MSVKNLTLYCLALLLLTAACSKDEEPVSEANRKQMEEASRNFLLAEQIFENAFETVDSKAKQQDDLNGFQGTGTPVEERGPCPLATFTTSGGNVFPATLTLDYGSGCRDGNGPELSGKIVATFNGLLLRQGTSISLNFNNFTHEGNTVSGTYKLTNDGADANGYPTFTGTVDGQVKRADGKIFSYKAITVSKQTEGNQTNFFTNGIAGILDDVWSSTREATLTNSDGQVLTINTGTPVRNTLVCLWPVTGLIELKLNNPAVEGTLDIGDGSCDNKAILTIGDNRIEIEL